MDSPILLAPPLLHSDDPPDAIHHLIKDLPIYASRSLSPDTKIYSLIQNQPFLYKQDLRAQFPKGFLRPNDDFTELLAAKKIEIVRTSGTSNDRLQCLWQVGWWDRHERLALSQNSLIRAFINSQYREAILTTPLCSDSVCKTGVLPMKERIVEDMLFLNTQEDPTRWTSTHLQQMLEDLEQFKPIALEADPVYLTHFARYLRDVNQSPPRLRWIIVTYEFVSVFHRRFVESVFKCPVFEFYGMTEAGVFFLECPEGRLHFCGQNCLVEILRPSFPSDLETTFAPSIGEIVVSTWGNHAQPLLRYRTNDLVEIDDTSCRCGMVGQSIRRLHGRIRDILCLRNGRAFTPRQIDSSLSDIAGILQYQCIHEHPNSVRVRFVADGTENPRDEIESKLKALWGDVEIALESRAFIPPEPSGKYRVVVPL